jgi:SAM-dependent methyltransferase
MNIQVTTRIEMEAEARAEAFKLSCNPAVLHLGSRIVAGQPDAVRKFFPASTRFVGLDFIAGPGVDVVADIHKLGDVEGLGKFDVLWSDAVLEHLERPWVAAKAMAAVTRRGGLCFHITHQTFPLHAVPNDYWRFSTEGLRVLFCVDTWWEVIRTAYCWPCAVMERPGEPAMPANAPCFVHAMILARRI